MHVSIRTLHPRYIVSRYAMYIYIIISSIYYIHITALQQHPEIHFNINQTNPGASHPRPSPGAASRSRFSISPSSTRKHLGSKEATGTPVVENLKTFVQGKGSFWGSCITKHRCIPRVFGINNIYQNIHVFSKIEIDRSLGSPKIHPLKTVPLCFQVP